MNTLYRFYNAAGDLLYIGLTVNPGKRMEKHAGTKEWWLEVEQITMEQHDDLAALREAERAAIQAEQPRYNIRLRGIGSTTDRVALLQKRGWKRIGSSGSQSWRHERYGSDTFTLSAAIGRETAPASPTAPVEPEPDGLVGRWFHSYVPVADEEDTEHLNLDGAGNKRQWQGQIIAREGHMFIAQLYSWWDGHASSQVICEPDEMRLWRFYGSNQEMHIALGCNEDFGAHRGGKCHNPVTHVIRDFHGMGPIYRCWKCIEFYSGTVEEL